MIADPRFVGLPKGFWAFVRLIGQECGYTDRKNKSLLVPPRELVEKQMKLIGIGTEGLDRLILNGESTWNKLDDYFKYRAHVLQFVVEPNLMDAPAAKAEYIQLKSKLKPKCPLPLNKQKGKKKSPAYLTGMVNMLLEAGMKKYRCDYDPRALITVEKNGIPLRTFSRRMDGAFPSVVNPLAVWEIKEYYYTTTFGSRVADGVYETLLDGMEIEELETSENIRVLHYLIIDAHYTWWGCGKSYLCRIVDMLHMGYVDEVIVGREVITRVPELVAGWVGHVAKTNE